MKQPYSHTVREQWCRKPRPEAPYNRVRVYIMRYRRRSHDLLVADHSLSIFYKTVALPLSVVLHGDKRANREEHPVIRMDIHTQNPACAESHSLDGPQTSRHTVRQAHARRTLSPVCAFLRASMASRCRFTSSECTVMYGRLRPLNSDTLLKPCLRKRQAQQG